MRDSLLIGGKAANYSGRIRAVAQASDTDVAAAVARGSITQGEATAGQKLRGLRSPSQVRQDARNQFTLPE